MRQPECSRAAVPISCAPAGVDHAICKMAWPQLTVRPWKSAALQGMKTLRLSQEMPSNEIPRSSNSSRTAAGNCNK